VAKKAQPLPLPEGVAKGAIRDNLEVVCFAVLLIVFFKTFVGQQFTIPSASMRNTLMIGDHLLVNKFIFAVPQWDWEAKLFPMRKVERGDIIVFRYPVDRDMDYVKRAAALPGDTFEIRNKRFYLNGQLLTGEWEHHIIPGQDVVNGRPQPQPGPWHPGRDLGPAMPPPGLWHHADPELLRVNRQGKQSLVNDLYADNIGPFTVPEGFVLALGDNRDNSQDSRAWGYVPLEHLRGRPFLVWWSFREGGDDDQNAKVPEHPGDVAMNFIDGARHFLVWTRWERTGTIPR
jgi:signal peptidase I